jgi:hypothetical protein
MKMVNGRSIRFPNGFHLSGDSSRIDNKKAARGGPSDIVLNETNERIFYPSAIVSFVKLLSSLLKCSPLLFHSTQVEHSESTYHTRSEHPGPDGDGPEARTSPQQVAVQRDREERDEEDPSEVALRVHDPRIGASGAQSGPASQRAGGPGR